jgi:hypothetical protein
MERRTLTFWAVLHARTGQFTASLQEVEPPLERVHQVGVERDADRIQLAMSEAIGVFTASMSDVMPMLDATTEGGLQPLLKLFADTMAWKMPRCRIVVVPQGRLATRTLRRPVESKGALYDEPR